MHSFRKLSVALLSLAMSFAHAQQGSAAPQHSAEEAAVRAVIGREIQAWQQNDPKLLASLYTEDAVWQNPFGVRLHGKAAIESFVTGLMSRPGYRAGKDVTPWTILEVRMLSATAASVWSDERIEGLVNDNSGVPMAPRHSFYLEVLTRKDGVWKISDFMVMDIVHLK